MAQRLFFNMGNLLSQFFLHFQVTLTGNHDALSLRAASTVHGFCPVADGCRAVQRFSMRRRTFRRFSVDTDDTPLRYLST